jgi:O-antigen/teichoic acid export membrane protein
MDVEVAYPSLQADGPAGEATAHSESVPCSSVEDAANARSWTGQKQAARAEMWGNLLAGRKNGWWARLVRVASGTHSLALADQAVVSATNFLTTILVGRWCGADELGVYAMGFSLLISWLCVQDSLISLPYTIYRHRPRRENAAEFAGSSLAQYGILSVLSILFLAATAGALSARGVVPTLVTATWILAAVMPFALLRDFGRRFAFSHLRVAHALLIDLAVAALQLAGLVVLAWSGALSAATAFAVVGTACAAVAAVWMYLARRNFVIRLSHVVPTLRQGWSLGKWLFGSQVTLLVQGYVNYWLLAWIVGTAATGVYAACMTKIGRAHV